MQCPSLRSVYALYSAEPREALTDDTPQTGDTCVDGRGCHSDTVTELQSDIVTSTAENAAKADDKANLTGTLVCFAYCQCLLPYLL
jgi:hypothetical protein